jgi:hypothetical protein
MIDVLFIALAIGFFVVADLFVRGCARILERGHDDLRGEDRS